MYNNTGINATHFHIYGGGAANSGVVFWGVCWCCLCELEKKHTLKAVFFKCFDSRCFQFHVIEVPLKGSVVLHDVPCLHRPNTDNKNKLLIKAATLGCVQWRVDTVAYTMHGLYKYGLQNTCLKQPLLVTYPKTCKYISGHITQLNPHVFCSQHYAFGKRLVFTGCQNGVHCGEALTTLIFSEPVEGRDAYCHHETGGGHDLGL